MADFQSGYNSIQEFFRYQFLALLVQLEKDYKGISDQLLDRIQSIIDSYTDAKGNIKQSDLIAVQLELDGVATWFSTTYAGWLDQNIVKGIDLAILGQDTAAQYFVKSFVAEYGTQFGTVKDLQRKLFLRSNYGEWLNEALRKQVWNKRWQDGAKLSDRIWGTDQELRANLKGMIEECVNKGYSAVDFSKAVEQYVKQPGKKWTIQIKPSKTGKGSLDYNALRLARTEVNQAYFRLHNLSDKDSVIVAGTKWNLSKSHPNYSVKKGYAYRGYPEICDYRAKADHHGLGPGVFPKGEAPLDHPNGLCFLTSFLYEGEQLVEQIQKKYSKAA